MKIFYGWVIVGPGIVVTCVGMGTMMSLSVFLQPMSLAMGRSPAPSVIARIRATKQSPDSPCMEIASPRSQ